MSRCPCPVISVAERKSRRTTGLAILLRYHVRGGHQHHKATKRRRRARRHHVYRLNPLSRRSFWRPPAVTIGAIDVTVQILGRSVGRAIIVSPSKLAHEPSPQTINAGTVHSLHDERARGDYFPTWPARLRSSRYSLDPPTVNGSSPTWTTACSTTATMPYDHPADLDLRDCPARNRDGRGPDVPAANLSPASQASAGNATQLRRSRSPIRSVPTP